MIPTNKSTVSGGIWTNERSPLYIQVSPELVAAGIVLCTAVSAPLMFLSAQILRILHSSLQDTQLLNTINTLDYTVAIGSIIGVCLTLTIFLLSRRFLLLPHCFTTAMLVESLLAPTAAILLHTGLISSDWQVTADTSRKINGALSFSCRNFCTSSECSQCK